MNESIFDQIFTELKKIYAAIIDGNKANVEGFASIAALLEPPPDVVGFKPSISPPQPQGVTKMPNVRSLGANVETSMMDDQMATITANPNVPLPTGSLIVYTVAPGAAVTLDTTTDPSSLTCGVKGVEHFAGNPSDEVVTMNFMNADGTAATPSTATFHMTQDPAELGDVTGFSPAISTPVPQAASHKKP